MDVSLALDLVRATYERQYEVAIIVSQDWDFGPAVRLAKEIAKAQYRRLVFESCFPLGPGSHSLRGVPGTTWIPIDQTTYDSCRDPRDYHPSKQGSRRVERDNRLGNKGHGRCIRPCPSFIILGVRLGRLTGFQATSRRPFHLPSTQAHLRGIEPIIRADLGPPATSRKRFCLPSTSAHQRLR